MALPKSVVATDNITLLDPEPNDVQGLTDSQLQAKFDKYGVDNNLYINDTLTTAQDTLNESLQTQITSNDGDISALQGSLGAVVLGQIPDGTLTPVKFNPNVLTIGFGTTTNTGNTYAVTLTPAPTSYLDGMGVSVKINADNTGASTLNVNSLGAIPLKSATGTDVTTLKANGVYTFRYNITTGNFILQGEGVDATPLVTSINAILNM